MPLPLAIPAIAAADLAGPAISGLLVKLMIDKMDKNKKKEATWDKDGKKNPPNPDAEEGQEDLILDGEQPLPPKPSPWDVDSPPKKKWHPGDPDYDKVEESKFDPDIPEVKEYNKVADKYKLEKQPPKNDDEDKKSRSAAMIKLFEEYLRRK